MFGLTEENLPTKIEELQQTIKRALTTEYTLRIVSYNAANKDHQDAIQDMASNIFPQLLSESEKKQPAIFIYAGQESVPYNDESIPERIINAANNSQFQRSQYTTLSYHYQSVFTKPLEYFFHWGKSRTELYIAYDPKQISPDDIKILAQGKSVERNRDHKGGVYTLLGIGTITAAVSSVHLDSFDPQNARRQLNRLTWTISNDADDKYLTIHNWVYIGDFNIRLKLGQNNIKKSVDEWLNLADTSLTCYPYPNTPTYGTLASPPNKKRPEHEDYGRLDHILGSEKNVNLKLSPDKDTVRDMEPKNTNDATISDHKMIMGDMVIDTKCCALQHPLIEIISGPIGELEQLCQNWIQNTNSAPDIEPLKNKITTIIRELNALPLYNSNPPTRIPYYIVKIFYCACLLGQYLTELNAQNNNESITPDNYFLLQIFKALLGGGQDSNDPMPNSLHHAPLERIAFLQPLAKKLKEHNIPHAGWVITRDEDDSYHYKLKYLGFFNKVSSHWTECEKNNAYFSYGTETSSALLK